MGLPNELLFQGTQKDNAAHCAIKLQSLPPREEQTLTTCHGQVRTGIILPTDP